MRGSSCSGMVVMRRCGLGGPQPVQYRTVTVAPIDRSLPFIRLVSAKAAWRCCAFQMMGCCATLLNFHASTQIPRHTQTHTYVHTMYKAHQAGISFRRSEPRTPCHVHTATVLHRTRSEQHMGRGGDQTDVFIFSMKFPQCKESYAATCVPRFLLRSVRVV